MTFEKRICKGNKYMNCSSKEEVNKIVVTLILEVDQNFFYLNIMLG